MSQRRFLIVRRLASAVFVLLTVFLVTSMCSYMTVSQPLLRMLYNSVSDYLDFLANLTRIGQKAAPVVLRAYAHSLLALVAAFGMALVVAVPAGLWAGLRPGSRLGAVARILSSLGTITPSFLLALLVMIFFVLYVFPLTGVRFILLFSETAFDPRRLLPIALTLAARPLAYFTTVVAAGAGNAVAGDYVRTAHSKGLADSRVIWRHVWPNVWPDLLSATPAALLFSLSSLPIVEYVFNWPGVGLTLLRSVSTSPVPGVSQAAMITFLFSAVGVTYAWVVLTINALRPMVYPPLRQVAER